MPFFGKDINKYIKKVRHTRSFIWVSNTKQCDQVVKARAYDRHSVGSKPTRTILLCPWERNFTALSPAWWSWQAV